MAVHEELPADAGQDAIDELQSIRQSIDNIDAALIHLLAERFKFTQSVGRLKARHGLPPADPAREFMQIQRLRGLAEDARLDPAFAEKFLNFIIAEVIHHHEQIAGDSGRDSGRTDAAASGRDAAASGRADAAGSGRADAADSGRTGTATSRAATAAGDPGADADGAAADPTGPGASA